MIKAVFPTLIEKLKRESEGITLATQKSSHESPSVIDITSSNDMASLQKQSFGVNAPQQSYPEWDIFHIPSKQTTNGQHTGIKEAFIMSASNTDTEELTLGDDGVIDNSGNDKNDRISSMFLANQSSSREGSETTSLYHPSPMSRPPSAKKKSSRPSTAMSRLNSEIVEGALLTSIFSIDKISYDVRMFDDRLTWTPVSLKQKRPASAVFDHRRKSTGVDIGSLLIHNICSVKLKNVKSAKTGTSTTIGFAVFFAQERTGRKLREGSIMFLCYSREVCMQWATKIKQKILAITGRPKSLLVLSSGTLSACQIWDDVVEPKLEVACVKGNYVEVEQPNSAAEHVKKVLSNLSSTQGDDAYDGILVLGSARLFSEVLNAIVNYKDEVLKSGVWHPNTPPVGVVPTSSNSFVAKETHGSCDAETAVFHAIYGCTQNVPVCEFYDHTNDQLLKCGLSASYGFSGGDTVRNSSAKGFASVQGSIKRGFAFTKALVKHRSYSCEIQYKDSLPTEEDTEILPKPDSNGYSIVNEHFVNDEDGEKIMAGEEDMETRDGDSGIWPQCEKWNNVPRANYLDITITSLPQHNVCEASSNSQLSAILLRDSTSRKDLFLGMGSQVSLNSTMSKSKSEVQSKSDVLQGSEFIVQPMTDLIVNGASSSNLNHSSTWTVDGCCVDAGVQEMQAKIHDISLVMYGRAPGQSLSSQLVADVLNLESSNLENLTLDSVA